MEDDIKQLPFNPIVKYAKMRIRLNKNLLILIVGGVGSGKTYAGLDLALNISKELETTFTIKNNMDFSFGALLKKMNLPENYKAGSVFLFEEVGSVASGSASREWQSKSNAFFHSFMQTSRHRNQILIMTCPVFGSLDKGSRELIHLLITMRGINKQNKKSYASVLYLQTNALTGKIYTHSLRIISENEAKKLVKISFDLPPEDILREYEAKKLQFTSKLNQRIIDADEGINNKGINNPNGSKHNLKPDEMRNLLALKFSLSRIAELDGRHVRTIQRILKNDKDMVIKG